MIGESKPDLCSKRHAPRFFAFAGLARDVTTVHLNELSWVPPRVVEVPWQRPFYTVSSPRSKSNRDACWFTACRLPAPSGTALPNLRHRGAEEICLLPLPAQKLLWLRAGSKVVGSGHRRTDCRALARLVCRNQSCWPGPEAYICSAAGDSG